MVTLIRNGRKSNPVMSKSKFVVVIPASKNSPEYYLTDKMVQAIKDCKEKTLAIDEAWTIDLKKAFKFSSLGGADKILNQLPATFTKPLGLPKVGRREF